MSTIPSATGTDYAALGLTANSEATGKKKTLGQDDFLKLMTTQIQNQDPLKPMENTEFFSQIAQFSTVSGIEKLQGSFSDLATQLSSSQALDASSLIGRDVLVPSSVGVLDADGLAGAIDVPSSGTTQIQIRDGNGVLVRTLDLGSQPAGQVAFNWNGTDASGNALPQGVYRISATVQGNGTSKAATTYALDRVASVALGASGLDVELASLGEVAFSSVKRIQ